MTFPKRQGTAEERVPLLRAVAELRRIYRDFPVALVAIFDGWV